MQEVAIEMPLVDREVRFRAFVSTHRHKAVGLAWRLVGGDPQAAEDVAQEAFARAWRALPRFREEARLSTWFYRILVRQAANHRRREGLRRSWRALTGREPASPQIQGDAPLRGRIAAALDALSAGQREVFVLVHLEGFTVSETAATLGKAEGTVKSHLHRALRALRGELADLWEA